MKLGRGERSNPLLWNARPGRVETSVTDLRGLASIHDRFDHRLSMRSFIILSSWGVASLVSQAASSGDELLLIPPASTQTEDSGASRDARGDDLSPTTKTDIAPLFLGLPLEVRQNESSAGDESEDAIPPAPAVSESGQVVGEREVGPPPAPPPKRRASRVDLIPKPLNQITTDISPEAGDLPENLAEYGLAAASPGTQSGSRLMVFEWEPTNLRYGNLYFEDNNTERYGYDFGVFQPLVSVGDFVARMPAIPHKFGERPPWKRRYDLGLHQPGGPVTPFIFEKPKFDSDGITMQYIATTGLIFLIP